MRYIIEVLTHGELIRTEHFSKFEDVRKRISQIEKESHASHSLLNVVVFEDHVKLFERFFG